MPLWPASVTKTSAEHMTRLEVRLPMNSASKEVVAGVAMVMVLRNSLRRTFLIISSMALGCKEVEINV